MHVLIVEARFYADIADELRKGAEAVLDAAGVTHSVAAVPGVIEIPAAVRYAVDASHHGGAEVDAYVALGCVIRGETTHHEHVARTCLDGLGRLATDHGLALGTGVLTCENREQAWERARTGGGDKGAAAAKAALAMFELRHRTTGR